MDPHLIRLDREIRSLTAELRPDSLLWHPPGKWSVAEILEHLYLTYTGTTKGFSRLLQSSPLPKSPTLKQRVAAWIVVNLEYFPKGVQSPAVARPRGLRHETISSDIVASIAEMDAAMTSCEQKFGPHAKVLDHPFLGPLSIVQWRKFHLRHGRHHLKQIKAILAGTDAEGP